MEWTMKSTLPSVDFSSWKAFSRSGEEEASQAMRGASPQIRARSRMGPKRNAILVLERANRAPSRWQARLIFQARLCSFRGPKMSPRLSRSRL